MKDGGIRFTNNNFCNKSGLQHLSIFVKKNNSTPLDQTESGYQNLRDVFTDSEKDTVLIIQGHD